jgi:TonB family protein
MNASTLAADCIAWILQSTLLLGIGLLLPTLFRLRDPRACLAYGQGLLVAVLLLPCASFLGPLEPMGMPAFSSEMAVSGRWLSQVFGGDAPGVWSLERILLAGLGLGTAGRLGWLGLGLLTLRAWRRGATPVELSPAAAEIMRRVETRARLLVSPRMESPVTFGWRRPVILLPAGFAALPAEAQRGILCHELLHVRRRDWLFALGEEGVRALLWFHPAVWLLLARIALHREQVVDREAVRLTGSRRAYLEALRAVAGRSWQTGFSSIPGLPFFHQGHLRERVVHLCKEVPMSRSRVTTLLATFAGLLALTAVLGILAFPMAGTAWAAQPVKVEGDVQRPEVLHKVDPEYPEGARKDRLEGKVIVKTVIDEQGRVQGPVVEGSSGHDVLDRSALEAVSAWTFKPATLHGKPVAVLYWLTINFKADEK